MTRLGSSEGAAMQTATDTLDTKDLLRRALLGESFTLDRAAYALHDLTQIALALHPGANLAIQNADLMTPIEKASIATVGRGRIVFL
jgi:hypothetical protein